MNCFIIQQEVEPGLWKDIQRVWEHEAQETFDSLCKLAEKPMRLVKQIDSN